MQGTYCLLATEKLRRTVITFDVCVVSVCACVAIYHICMCAMAYDSNFFFCAKAPTRKHFFILFFYVFICFHDLSISISTSEISESNYHNNWNKSINFNDIEYKSTTSHTVRRRPLCVCLAQNVNTASTSFNDQRSTNQWTQARMRLSRAKMNEMKKKNTEQNWNIQ